MRTNGTQNRSINSVFSSTLGLVIFFVFIAGLASQSALAVSYSPDGYSVSTPSDFNAYRPEQIYYSDDPNTPYVKPWDKTSEQNNEVIQKHQLIQQADQLVQQLNPQNQQGQTIINEWQQLRPQLLEILNKQSEVDELLTYISALSRISDQQQNTIFLSNNDVIPERTPEQRAECDAKLLNNPVYAWPRCQ